MTMRARSDPALRRRHAEEAPLSAAQESLWFVEQAHPGTAAYNVPLLLHWNEPVDVPALRTALAHLVARHESLRTTYRVRDGRPVQLVAPPGPVDVHVRRLAARPSPEELAPPARLPFDLESGPVLRCHLWQGAPEGDSLLIALHHIAFDGWSLSTLLDDLLEAYEAALAGGTVRSPGPPVQYADFVAWERESWEQRDVEGRAAARADELIDADEPPLLPGRHARVAAIRAGGQLTFPVPTDLWERTGRLATRLRATPFVVLLAAFQEALRRWSGSHDFLVGTVMANRPKPALEGVVGCFVNMVPLRCRPTPAMTFEELCLRSRTECFRALAYQDIPFDRLTALTAAKRGTGRAQLADVALGVQNMPMARTAGHPRWRQPTLLPTGTARHDLLLLVEERTDGVTGTIEHDIASCPPEMVQRFRDGFLALLDAAVAAPGTPLAALPLSSREPGRAVPGALVGAARDLSRTDPPADRTLLDVVAARLAEEPDAVAVSAAGTSISRRELDDWSWAVAASLGLGHGVVPVFAARGPALVAGWLGALRAGSAYVPLDLDAPVERLDHVLGDLDVRVVLADEAGAAVIRRLRSRVEVLDLAALRHGPTGDRRPPALSGDDTAVVIHTSGTTGRPKSIPVPHRGLANTVLWWAEDAALGPRDRLLCVVGTSFDPATFETFRALVSGAELVYADDVERKDGRALLRLLRTTSVVSLTPGLLRAVLDAESSDRAAGPPGPGLRLVYLGGERLTRSLATECARRWNVPLRNVYGPTEVSCTSLSAPVDPADPQPPPIGAPIWSTRAYVLGPAGEELPPGAPGELYLAGAGVSKGYLGRPDLTSASFLPDPFAPAHEPDARMYRTGDRVAVRADGLISYLGRTDDQVKILGNRIEPAEVAALLEEQHDAVLSAAVTGASDPERLVAYVVLDGSCPAPTHDEMVRPLRRWLPAAAVPSEIHVVDEMPRTANDKTDLRALRALRSTPLPRAPRRRAHLDAGQRWASEQFLAALRSDGRAPVAAGARELALEPDDDFFALGGHSLLAVRMLAAIERGHGVQLALGDFLEQPTVAGLARLRDLSGREPRHESPREPQPAQAPAEQGRYPATPTQQRMVFLDRIASQRAAYLAPTLVELTGRVDRAALARALAHVLGHHPALRSRFVLDREDRRVLYRTDGTPPEVAVSDWTGAGDERLAAHLEDICWSPFHLGTDAPVRAEVAAAGDRTVLALVAHHVVADGWAQQILLRQLGDAYRAVVADRCPQLPPAVHPAAVADGWAALDPARRAERTEALLARLRGAPVDIALPRDRERPSLQATAAGTRCLRLPVAASARLRKALADEGVTTSMAAPALLAATLAAAGSQCDFLFAYPWAGRETAAVTEAVAMLVRTLVLRVDLRDSLTWRRLMSAVREESLAGYRYADVPFEALVAELDPRRGLSRPPVTPVLVTTVTDPPVLPDLGPEVRARQLAPSGLRIKYELELTLRDVDACIELEIAYATALFDPPTVDALLGGLARAAEQFVAHPDSPVLPQDGAFDDGRPAPLGLERSEGQP